MVYPRVSLYALMLASAGIPLYIHLPHFASSELGVGLGAIATILIAIRFVDLVQDPLIGWAIDRWPQAQSLFAGLAAGGLAVGFPLLFSLNEGPYVLAKMVAALVLLFSAYSMGMILLYGCSATLASEPTPRALMTLAGFRETGMLVGVVLAAIAPLILAKFTGTSNAYPAFGWFLAAIALICAWVARPIWNRPIIPGKRFSVASLRKGTTLHLLLVALVNSLPVAITSTLFLFFVEDRLELDGMAGLLLLLFFLSAGVSVPFWAKLSQHFSPRIILLIAMPLAIFGFAGAAFLVPGQAIPFALICVASGAALGADMVILPAMFSVALAQAQSEASLAFGIWSFAGKLGLALAALLVLPILEGSGFKPTAQNSDAALSMLSTLYAIVPCILKLCALALVFALPSKDITP